METPNEASLIGAAPRELQLDVHESSQEADLNSDLLDAKDVATILADIGRKIPEDSAGVDVVLLDSQETRELHSRAEQSAQEARDDIEDSQVTNLKMVRLFVTLKATTYYFYLES